MAREPRKDETKTESERRKELGDNNSYFGFLLGLIREPKRQPGDLEPREPSKKTPRE